MLKLLKISKNSDKWDSTIKKRLYIYVYIHTYLSIYIYIGNKYGKWWFNGLEFKRHVAKNSRVLLLKHRGFPSTAHLKGLTYGSMSSQVTRGNQVTVDRFVIFIASPILPEKRGIHLWWYTGWWYSYPSEKYESQLGWWNSQLNGPSYIKFHGSSHHQPPISHHHDINETIPKKLETSIIFLAPK